MADSTVGRAEFTWTPAEHAMAWGHSTRRIRVAQSVVVVLIGAMGVMETAWSIVALCAWLVLVINLAVRRQATVQREKMPWLSDPVSWSWADDRVSITTSVSHLDLTAGSISGVKRSKRLIMLETFGGYRGTFPERAFATPRDLHTFVACAEALAGEQSPGDPSDFDL